MRNTISTIFWILSTASTIRSKDSTITADTEKIGSLFQYEATSSYPNNYRTCIMEPLACIKQLTTTELEQVHGMLENWKIMSDKEYKNTTNKILVLGNSGSGVSTFVKFLTEKDEKLKSEEAGIATEEYLITDGNKIGSSENQPSTQHLEEVILSANTSIIDIPGFSELRSVKEDIFVTYNIANYLWNLYKEEHNTCTKIVILTEYFSVQHGTNKQNFINLLKNINNNFEITNRNNIILIVTKVPNKYNTERIISDKDVIINIADFINKVKHYLNEKLENTSCEDHKFFTTAIEMIDTLLEMNDSGHYKRINIFRQPDKQGVLLNIKSARENKRSLINFLNLFTDQCPQVRNTMSILMFNIPTRPTINTRTSPRFEKFKSCIQETVNANIQESYNELKNAIPQHSVSKEINIFGRFYYDIIYNRIDQINMKIKNMYKLKHHFNNL